MQIDKYVERRLRDLLLKRAGLRLAAGRVLAWNRPFFEALGLTRLRGTIRYLALSRSVSSTGAK